MTDDLMERIEGCIANAEYEDEWATLIDARDRIEALREALAEQVEACFCPDCEMCFRHEQLLKEAGQ